MDTAARAWWFGVILLVSGQAPALSPELQLSQFTHKAWQAGEDRSGLPQNSVFSIAQTPDGYLWLATQEGLVRFDGVRFTTFNSSNTEAITHNDVWRLLADEQGLWVATRGGGLLRYRQGRFEHWDSADGLAGDTIHSLWRDADGSLWVGTEFGLSQLRWAADGALGVRSFREDYGLTSNTIYAIYRDSAGRLYAGTDSAGINLMNADGRFVPWAGDQRLAQATIYDLREDSRGALWIATGNGLYRWHEGQLQRFGEAEGLSSARVRAIFEDRHGQLWFGTDGGLNRYVNGRFSHFTSALGLTSDQVGALNEDREGNLWIGTDGGGLNRLSNSRFVPYGVPEGLANDNVRAVMQSRDGSLWVGSFGGIDVLENGRIRHIGRADGLSSDIVLSLAQSADGAIWAGTLDGGLNRIHAGQISRFGQEEGLVGRSVLSLAEDQRGRLWIGTRGSGLSRYVDGRFENFTMDTGLPNNSIRVILASRNGDVWLGTLGGGLVRYRDGQFTTIGVAEGLSNGRIFSLHEDAEGSLWIGTFGGGLSRYADGRFSHFRMADGLHDDSIFQILEDDDGYLWLSSNRGISRVEKAQLKDHAAGRVVRLQPKVYGQWDGMRNREANGGHQPAGWRTRDGHLWFPTIRGLVTTDPARSALGRPPPTVMIEKVLVDGQPQPAAEALRLAAGARKLEFRFTALSFSDPDSLRFRYILEGFDEDWVEAGDQRSAQYTNLPPGNYLFRLTAAAGDSDWNPVGARQPLVQQAQVWQQPYFTVVYLLAALALVAAVAGLYRRRMTRLNARQQELMTLIREREQAADALRDANSTLRGQIESLAQDEADEAASDSLIDARRASRDATEGSDLATLVDEFRATVAALSRKERQLKATRLALANSKEQMESYNLMIRRYLPQQLVSRIMSGRHFTHTTPERKMLTICQVEVGGFGDCADEAGAERASARLNEFLTELGTVADRYYATIGDLGGDALMILFGAPDGAGAGVDAQGAVMMALELLERRRDIQRRWRAENITDAPEVRIGLHTGFASVGDFGSSWRKSYTAFGDAPRLARRIQAQCPANSILLSHATLELVRHQVTVRARGTLSTDAGEAPVELYEVLGASFAQAAPPRPSVA
jgi:ligand-binding sensor domain-containing protein/class 3 adenylate cyclase